MHQAFILVARTLWGLAAAIGGASVGLWIADKTGAFDRLAAPSQSFPPAPIDRLPEARIEPPAPSPRPFSAPTDFKLSPPKSESQKPERRPSPPLPAAGNAADQILISVTDRRLRLILADGRTHSFPIAVGYSRKLIPIGLTEIIGKRRYPTWTPTPAMRRKNPNLPAAIPPGPHNPMGDYALDLGWPYYRIHGTNDPQSVGQAVSSGCFRMLPNDIRTLFNHVKIGAKVRIIEGSLPKSSLPPLI